MDIKLEGVEWFINDGEYIICGDENSGYEVCDGNYNSLYTSDSFEKCLTWCWNSR